MIGAALLGLVVWPARYTAAPVASALARPSRSPGDAAGYDRLTLGERGAQVNQDHGSRVSPNAKPSRTFNRRNA